MKRRKTRERVKALRVKHHLWTLNKIGQAAGGISREWVRRILGEEGLPTNTRRKPHCGGCKKELPATSLHSTTIRSKHVYLCDSCFSKRKKEREQERRRHLITFRCEICGTLFSLPRYKVRYIRKRGMRILWCSKKCQGKAFNKKGWPWEKRRKLLRKYERVWKIRYTTRLRPSQISRLLRIPYTTVYKIIKKMPF